MLNVRSLVFGLSVTLGISSSYTSCVTEFCQRKVMFLARLSFIIFESIAFVWLVNSEINYWLKSRVYWRKDPVRIFLFLDSLLDGVFCFSKAKYGHIEFNSNQPKLFCHP